VNPRVPLLAVYFVRLRHGAADLNAFDTKARSLQVLGSDGLDNDAAAVQGSIRPQAVGWWVLAALAALAGLAVLGQAVARQAASERADRLALSAVGVRPRDFVLTDLARALVIGIAGAAGAVALAALLSPLAPAGEARLADAAAGAVVFDPLILPLGALATMLAVVVLAAPPAIRQARLLASHPPPRPVPVGLIRMVAAAGAPPSALIGIRSALERRRGGQPVPVATALLGTVMAVAALCATAVFGASLTHLVSTPALYGVPFQVYFTNEGAGSAPEVTGALLTGLRRDRAIGRITLATVEEITVNGHPVRVLGVIPVRGRTLVSAVDGRLPRQDREIMLGAATMRATGARPGGLVKVMVTSPGGSRRLERFLVTGRAAFPSNFGTGGLGSGAVMTLGALIDAQCPAGPGRAGCQQGARRGIDYAVLTRSVPGPAGDAALTRHIHQYPGDAVRPEKPTELVNFGESVNFPLLFGAMLSLFGAATLVHLLLVSMSRRRTETGLLKVIGFVRRQIAAAVCWQATTVALVGLIVGVPLGVLAGRLVWRDFAINVGVVPVAVVQPWPLAALAVAVLAAANLLAVGPALLATRSRPGELLRAE
jgi:ABC-type lipoprotein release transport system permease subunit